MDARNCVDFKNKSEREDDSVINGDFVLKNCPCCGGYAHPMFEDFGQTVWIQCDVCGLQTTRYPMHPKVDGKSGGEWACDTWNRRLYK